MYAVIKILIQKTYPLESETVQTAKHIITEM